MEIEFDQEYLEELYYYGRTSNKKYRFQPEIIRNYVEIVYTLKIVTRVEDLYLLKGLHYEKKHGNLAGVEAVWINKQFRLEFISPTEDWQDKKRTICRLLRISNHYIN